MANMVIDISALRDDDDLDAPVTQFSTMTMDIKSVCFKAEPPGAQALATRTSPTHEPRMPGRSPLRTRSTSTQRRSQRGSSRRRQRERAGSDEDSPRGFGPDSSLKFTAEPSLTPEAALGMKVGKQKTIEAASNGPSVAQASSMRTSVASYAECAQGGGNHKFHAWVTPRHALCSKCHQKKDKGSELFGCEFCQIDLCQTCYSGIVPVPGLPVSSFLSIDTGGTAMTEATSDMGKSRTAKQCQLCGNVFRGFGDMCSICRKNPQGMSKKCSVCHNYFTGYTSMCEECAGSQMSVG